MILVTGGLGYIGSHACVALLDSGYDILIVDNLSNSSRLVKPRLEELTRREVSLEVGDVRDRSTLERAFSRGGIEAVVHFASLKVVEESTRRPLEYYDNNIGGTLALLHAMRSHGVGRIVFSSSAAVYGETTSLPFREDHPLRPVNPYGRIKLIIEDLLRDVAAADHQFRFAALRYFNPVGAHASARLGEDPKGEPRSLMPYVCRVAAGQLPKLKVFGYDYGTPDGTCVRDYIHVMDLAIAHVAALRVLLEGGDSMTVNLGTGRGYSVLEIVQTFESATGVRVPHEMTARRPGDVASSYADPSFAARVLGWRAERTLQEMCRDAWRWQCANPRGYMA